MILRMSAVKSRKLDEASMMSIATQASTASFGPSHWHGLVGAKKRCAECTYLRLSHLPLGTQALSMWTTVPNDFQWTLEVATFPHDE